MADDDSPLLADVALGVAPTWLSNIDDVPIGQGGRVVWGSTLPGDALLDKMLQAVDARLPTRAQPDALALIGADRAMPQGPGETTDAYARRLQQAFETWQHAGQAPTVMRQVLIALGTQCKIAIVATPQGTGQGYFTSFRAEQDVSLPPARWVEVWWWDTGYGVGGAPSGKNGRDPHPLTMASAWWRMWLVLWSVAPDAWAQPAPTLGSSGPALGDPSICLGFNVPAGVIESIRTTIRTWKCAHAWYRWIVVSFDPLFADWAAVGVFYPTSGQYGDPVQVVSGVQKYLPPASLRFCPGVK